MNEGTKAILRKMGYHKQVQMVEAGDCPDCGEPVKEVDFKTPLDKKEFEISGLCQKCQDRFFNLPEAKAVKKGGKK